MFDNLSKKFGFTKSEINVTLFLTAVFIVAFSAKHILKEEPVKKVYDYSSEDSLFYFSGEDEIIKEDKSEPDLSNIDYKQEVLDFNKRNFEKNTSSKLPAEKSIDINNAGLEEIIKLPGIGKKTAEKIIEYRNLNGRFSALEDLLNIKGIGNSKLNNIKKYIFLQ